jgi:hypothetical protein
MLRLELGCIRAVTTVISSLVLLCVMLGMTAGRRIRMRSHDLLLPENLNSRGVMIAVN